MNRQIAIATAGSRRSTTWPASTLYWSEFVARLQTPVRSTETVAEYFALPKSKQDDLKDVGGFVGGTFTGSRRKAELVTGRDLVTLDADSITGEELDSLLKRVSGLSCAYAIYSTRKHLPEKPRLRIICPLDRTVSPEEYEAIARKLAEMIGMAFMDPTTFEPSRLMYWPSCCRDGEYLHYAEDKALLSAGGMLALYPEWQNAASWPQVPGAPERQQKLADRQGDPTAKKGVVGAFCRTYSIYRALDELIPGVYEPSDMEGRYTFVGGSTTSGAVIYDSGNFLYSHHSTDPCGGKLVNSFDLVRIHKFGDKDDEAKPDTPTNRLPSYTAMTELALSLPAVSLAVTQDNHAKAMEAFDLPPGDGDSWMSLMDISPTGLPAKTIDNAVVILEYDPALKGALAFDDFARRMMAMGPLPWDSRTERRPWSDPDDASLLHYLEKGHKLQLSERKVEAAVVIVSQRHKFNDIQEYLTGLLWDGVPRLDTWLRDYYGCRDNAYTRAVSRKGWTAAIARAMSPGCKYDCMPILVGPQGTYKSTGIRIMGGAWYSDSLTTFEGKEAAEQLQGAWICEVPELASTSKSEANVVKQMLSRSTDRFRAPYGRRTAEYPRTNIFYGTTNDREFLRDSTGERRFWPIGIRETTPLKDVFAQMPAERDQLWAEAFVRWQTGEYLDLSGEAKAIWEQEVKDHKVGNTKEGIIIDFLARPLPRDWEKKDTQQRRLYWAQSFGPAEVETYDRRFVCAAEIWVECFNREVGGMRQMDTRELSGIMDGLTGWEKLNSSARFGPYGTQRGYRKNCGLGCIALSTEASTEEKKSADNC